MALEKDIERKTIFITFLIILKFSELQVSGNERRGGSAMMVKA